MCKLLKQYVLSNLRYLKSNFRLKYFLNLLSWGQTYYRIQILRFFTLITNRDNGKLRYMYQMYHR